MLRSGVAFGLFALLAIAVPGVALQRLIVRTVDAALVIPLGTAVSAGAYWLSLVVGAPWLVPSAIAVMGGGLLWRRDPWRLAPGPPWRGAVPPMLALIVLLLVTQYPWNRLAENGDFLIDPVVASDTAFHVGLTRELTLGYPPQVPGVSGFPLGYHLGADLVRAAALRWAGVDPYDSISRYDVTLWALALVLSLRTLTHRLAPGAWAVALVPWTLLATDFSFVFAGNPQAHWWTDLLRGNLLLSLAVSNPVIPALGLALGALIALARHEAGEGRGWLALACLQSLVLPFFKVFLGAQLALGLGVAYLLRPARRRAVGLAALPAAIATAALALGQGGATVDVVLAPLDLVHVTRQTLGLDPVRGVELAVWTVFWLGASLGLRLIGLPSAVRSLREDAPAAALAVMALSGWPLGLLLRVSAPDVLPGQSIVNDAAYLVEQSGPLLWIFAVVAVGRLIERRRAEAPWLLLGAASLCLPSTVQFVTRKATEPPDPLPAAVVRAMRALEGASRPGDVVLQRPAARFPPAPVVLIGRRVPYERFTPYLTQFVRREDLERRHEAVHRFFRTRDPGEARQIAESLGATFVCLYGPDRVRFPVEGVLEPIHAEALARVYRLRPEPAGTRPSRPPLRRRAAARRGNRRRRGPPGQSLVGLPGRAPGRRRGARGLPGRRPVEDPPGPADSGPPASWGRLRVGVRPPPGQAVSATSGRAQGR
jgi:hypothetical protein